MDKNEVKSCICPDYQGKRKPVLVKFKQFEHRNSNCDNHLENWPGFKRWDGFYRAQIRCLSCGRRGPIVVEGSFDEAIENAVKNWNSDRSMKD